MTVGGIIRLRIGRWNKGYPTLGTYLFDHLSSDEEILHAG